MFEGSSSTIGVNDNETQQKEAVKQLWMKAAGH
jgi:hypothetical protein